MEMKSRESGQVGGKTRWLSHFASSIRLREDHFGTAEHRWSAGVPATSSVERDKPGLSGYLVHLVSLIQPNNRDRRDRPNEQDRLASFFSSLPLGSFASLEIPQTYLDGFPRNFCPADLRIFGEDCGRLGILNFQTQNLNDTVIDLNICHGYPPLGEQ
jgi:hypothetical protein